MWTRASAKTSSKLFSNVLAYCLLISRELLELIRSEGAYLTLLYPSEFMVHNILCIVMKFIREDAQILKFGEKEELTAFDSLIVSAKDFVVEAVRCFQKLWNDPKDDILNVDMQELKKNVMVSIEEYTLDLDSSSEEMAKRAPDHVTAADKVLTFRYSGSSTLQVSP